MNISNQKHEYWIDVSGAVFVCVCVHSFHWLVTIHLLCDQVNSSWKNNDKVIAIMCAASLTWAHLPGITLWIDCVCAVRRFIRNENDFFAWRFNDLQCFYCLHHSSFNSCCQTCSSIHVLLFNSIQFRWSEWSSYCYR